jgi:hypothetical protein
MRAAYHRGASRKADGDARQKTKGHAQKISSCRCAAKAKATNKYIALLWQDRITLTALRLSGYRPPAGKNGAHGPE